jgi:hypothetical protein
VARLTWSAFGKRFYETGVDRGVLYVSSGGVAWPGLISVSEAPSGGDAKPYYFDGVKFLNLAATEEFEATLNAFFSPSEFAACDGIAAVQNGLFASQQPRKSFGLSYRTRIGNDIDGPEHGYKIHLVYNALAEPSSRDNASLGGNADPDVFSWKITTLAPALTGFKPSAHLVVDSRLTDPDVLAAVEDQLYGSVSTSSALPTPDELVAIFTG